MRNVYWTLRRPVAAMLIVALAFLCTPTGVAHATFPPLPGYDCEDMPDDAEPLAFPFKSANELLSMDEPSTRELVDIDAKGKYPAGSPDHILSRWKNYLDEIRSGARNVDEPLTWPEYRDKYVQMFNNRSIGSRFEEVLGERLGLTGEGWSHNRKLPAAGWPAGVDPINRRVDFFNLSPGVKLLYELKSGSGIDKAQLADLAKAAQATGTKLIYVFGKSPSQAALDALRQISLDMVDETAQGGIEELLVQHRCFETIAEPDVPPPDGVLSIDGLTPADGGLDVALDESPDNPERAAEERHVARTLNAEFDAAEEQQAQAESGGHEDGAAGPTGGERAPIATTTTPNTTISVPLPVRPWTPSPAPQPGSAPAPPPVAPAPQAPVAVPIPQPVIVPAPQVPVVPIPPIPPVPLPALPALPVPRISVPLPPIAQVPQAPVPLQAPTPPVPVQLPAPAPAMPQAPAVAAPQAPAQAAPVGPAPQAPAQAAPLGPPAPAYEPPKTGGIDFTNLELRYVADTDDGGGPGVRYAFAANGTPTGAPAYGGRRAAKMSSDAFFVWLALSPDKFWVNLYPGQEDRIVDAAFGRTQAAQILLEADLEMKNESARLQETDTDLGRRFVDALQGEKCFLGRRQWIKPLPATVHQDGGEFYVLDAPLTVDIGMDNGYDISPGTDRCTGQDPAVTEQNGKLYRDMIMPALIERVNHAPAFADLRRVYTARVAAEWFVKRNADKPTAYADVIGSGNIDKWIHPWDPTEVFNRYMVSFRNGVASFSWKTADGTTWTRSWGGVDFNKVEFKEIGAEEFTKEHPEMAVAASRSLFTAQSVSSQSGQGEPRVWLGGLNSKHLMSDVWTGDPAVFVQPPRAITLVAPATSNPVFYVAIALPVLAWLAAAAVMWQRRHHNAGQGGQR